MLEPLELQVFPSCYNCLSWSEDGEIAVAAGENIQVITPKTTSEGDEPSTSTTGSNSNWHTTRFRANVFTSNEWPIIFPQTRDQFSLGAEQSISNVVSLGWSPPGIAKYRRCILAVLTSNLVLSFYRSNGPQSKWTRIGIANKALESHFASAPQGSPSPRLRKSNIRSFTWGPALKIPTQEQPTDGFTVPAALHRWGFFILIVTNDDNDIIILRVGMPTSESMDLEVLSSLSLQELSGKYGSVQPSSVFASALQSQRRILALASGPWLYQQQGSADGELCSATANIATIFGTQLKILKINIHVRLDDQSSQSLGQDSHHELLASVAEDNLMDCGRLGDYHFTGPVEWIYKNGSNKLYIAAGVLGGIVLLSMSDNTYKGLYPGTEPPSVHYFPLLEPTSDTEEEEMLHCERISGLAMVLDDESESPILHLTTVGGSVAAMSLSGVGGVNPPFPPRWKNQLDNARERFDIDRDLGGLAVSRVWGLAATRGLVAAAVTMHPGDMVEYRTSAEERCSIIFSTATGEAAQIEASPFHKPILDLSMDSRRDRHDIILQYILHAAERYNEGPSLSPKVVYAAACCVIVGSQNAELLSQARNVLEKLAKAKGVDLTDEITKCSTPGNSINPKPMEDLNGQGKDIFETCEVCDAGIAWYSAQEAQCANGHLFVRCSLTCLAIQEPETSKFCSWCKAEYLDESLIDPSSASSLQKTCNMLSDVFDTCIYCNGKFRP